MTSDQIILFGLFGAVFAMLLWGRYRYDLVAFTALLLGVVLGVVPVKDAFSGFGHPATIIVALVLIVAIVNIGNILTALGLDRRHELAIRSALALRNNISSGFPKRWSESGR